MSHCIFRETGEESPDWRLLRCTRVGCGRLLAVPQSLARQSVPLLRAKCRAPSGSPTFQAAPAQLQQPSAAERVRSLADATLDWMAAGCPERSAEEQHALAAICAACEHYRPDPVLPLLAGGQCDVCGCGLQPERKLLNAFRYATYWCVLGRWDRVGSGFARPPGSNSASR